MGRIGNRTHPGRYVVNRWKDLDAKDSMTYLEQRVMSTDRLSIVRCVYRKGGDFPEHFHPQQQITIIEEGALIFEISGNTVEVGQGQMIAIEPFVRHATRLADGYERVVALNLFLRETAPARATGPSNGKGGVATILTPAH